MALGTSGTEGFGGFDSPGSGRPGGRGDAPGPGGSFSEGRAPSQKTKSQQQRERGKAKKTGGGESVKAPKQLSFRHIKIDWSAYTVDRGVRQGQRQTSAKDIRLRGELSGEDWGKTFEKNYAAVSERAREFGLKRLPTEDKLLYEGYQLKQKAAATRGLTLKKEKEYGGPGEFAQAKKAYETRGQRAEQFETLATQSLSQWQAKYNVQANLQENIAQSQKRVKYRERFASMQISRERTRGRKTRATLRRGASGLAVNFGNGAATGLGIPT